VDAFYEAVLERVRAIPGVDQVGATQMLPLSGSSYGISAHSIDGRELPSEEQDRLSSQIRVVRPEFFASIGIPVLRGRAIGDADRFGAPPVAMLNESAARAMFPGTDPLGHQVTIGTSFGIGRGRGGGTVIGVVADTRDFGADGEPTPIIYLSHAQFPLSLLQLVMRTARPPETMASSVRAAVAAVDPNVPVFEMHTMEALFSESVAQPRFLLTLLSLFAVTAVALASIGLYGVIAHGVSERTREIGIRIALGARRGDVLRMVMRSGGMLAALGLLVGLAASFAGARVLRTELYGVEPVDAMTLIGAVLVLFPVALLASWIPARRATRVDPAVTLRME
jgi:putative ABC transport system permease protein